MIDISGNINGLLFSEPIIILTLILMLRNFKPTSSESYVSNGKTEEGLSNLVYRAHTKFQDMHGLSTLGYNNYNILVADHMIYIRV